MPTQISAIGNKATVTSESGFSLVELLAVLAILSLMIGAVLFSLPAPRSQTDRATEAMEIQLNRFLQDGAVAGEMRAFGATTEAWVLYRHDGLEWHRMTEISWPDDARLQFRLNDALMDLQDDPAPTLLFEPYGTVPNFNVSLSTPRAEYRLSTNDRGQIIRTVER